MSFFSFSFSFFPNFANMQATRKIPLRDFDKLQIADIGLDKTSAPSRKKRPESLSMSAAL